MGQGTVMTKGEQLSVKQQGRLWWRERELREALASGALSYAEYMAKTGVMLAQAGVARKSTR